MRTRKHAELTLSVFAAVAIVAVLAFMLLVVVIVIAAVGSVEFSSMVRAEGIVKHKPSTLLT